MTRREAAAWRRVSVSTVQYWIDRYRGACDQDRVSGAWAEDRPSTPHHQPLRCSEQVHDRVCEERRRTGWGPRLIASELQMSHATVSRCLSRRGLSRAPKSPREVVRRYEWPCPGDLLQMDVKRFQARAKALPIWLMHYNTTRNHSGIGNRPPITRVRNEPRQNT